MRKYILYIAPELHKFEELNWTNKFFKQFQDNPCFDEFNLPKDLNEFSQQFSTKEGILGYLNERPEQNVIALSGFLSSTWRNNPGLFNKLTSNSNWEDLAVPLQRILVYPAEPCLREYFKEDGYSLCRILKDTRIMGELPYRKFQSGANVIFETLLAIQNGQDYSIFDGVHRAIQLAVNGDEELRLHYAIKG